MQSFFVFFLVVCGLFLNAAADEDDPKLCPICGRNEVLKCGPSPCCTLTCHRRTLDISCIKENTTCGADGLRPRCFCKVNYLLDETIGKCVPTSKCPCKDRNAVFSYSNPCVNRCGHTVCPLYVVWGCFCKKGFCADKTGLCVPIPKTTQRPSTTAGLDAQS